MVLLNSSPFTLVVSTGSTTTQIAAFTSDKVYVYSSGPPLPVTVTPQLGAGTPGLGQDSTVYATWYHDEPPGTYPAALGSGAVAFAPVTVTDDIQSLVNVTVPANGSVDIANFLTAPFSGVAVEVTSNSIGPVVLLLQWFSNQGGMIAERGLIIPAAAGSQGVCSLNFPHLGDICVVSIRNATGSSALLPTVIVSQSTSPIAQFTASSRGAELDPFFPVFMRGQNTVPGSTSLQVLVDSQYVYAGPATLSIVSGAASFVFDVQIQDSQGNWNPNFLTIGTVDLPGTAPQRASREIILPAAPVRICASNLDVSAHTMTAYMMIDDWRVGG